ncbi:ABC transporter ATP-binding protein [Orrella marina]|uniref:ABC transporter ATP-binding protein n=1 Tax=Orrella marina TaxID=2163011 RepID=A0A2R4XKD7_9BURK|nr:ABC transporter ATP-binding protein [Orrella marina]AWB34256.1 ABC transporter ATP-binding protein [Orrella marina]
MTTTPALEISGLNAWYGESHVLHGVDLTVEPGEVVCLLGRNGAGRTSTLRAILGLTSRTTGTVRVNGIDLGDKNTHDIARLGIGYCPEERGIFASLTCEQNLLLPPVVGQGQALTIDEIYDMFPNLKERRNSPGGRLSGGEQQMLAIARILRTGANLLLLDEITEGLAPVIVQKLGEVVRTLKQRSFTIVLVEQNFRFASQLADRNYVIEHGKVVLMVKKEELSQKQKELETLLGV